MHAFMKEQWKHSHFKIPLQYVSDTQYINKIQVFLTFGSYSYEKLGYFTLHLV